VDVDIEAEASRIMYEASKQSFENRKGLVGEIVAPFDDFAGIKMVSVGDLPAGSYMSMGFDTAGTKVEIAQRVNIHDTIAFDLFAMVCDDAVLRGGEPVLVGTNLDIKSLGSDERYLPIIRELAAGYVAAAKEANVAIINGEIAQMGPLVSGWGDFPYHWGAACVWFGRKDKLFTGKEIMAGDSVVMLREPGFRTNGLSLARSIFEARYGSDWHLQAFEGSTLGRAVLTPSKIYSRFIIGIHGGFATEGTTIVHGVAHITGGGIPEKLARVLRMSGLGARLEALYEPAAVIKHCQEVGNVSDVDAYRAWNMGQGMAVITPEPEKVIAEAKAYGIEAQRAGEITPEPGIALASKGSASPDAFLSF
jgi:phosphoribosylformylglycinamidine cyclo-ligase